MCSTRHLMGGIGIGNIDGEERVGGSGGVGGDGVIAGDGGGLRAEGGELAGEPVDLDCVVSVCS